jgi:hypothetical protein
MERDIGAGELIFDMSLNEIRSVADELGSQRDRNHPTRTGSYKDFLDTMQEGRNRLSTQEKYNHGNR